MQVTTFFVDKEGDFGKDQFGALTKQLVGGDMRVVQWPATSLKVPVAMKAAQKIAGLVQDHLGQFVGLALSDNGVGFAFEILPVNLHDHLQCKLLSYDLKKKISFQISRSIQFLHAQDIVHGNLSTRSIWLSQDLQFVKVSGYGLSFVTPQPTMESDVHALGQVLQSIWSDAVPEIAKQCLSDQKKPTINQVIQALEQDVTRAVSGLSLGTDSGYNSPKLSMSLHEACRFGNMDICRELLKSGANINAKDKLGDTPLHIAAKAGNIELVTLFLHSHCNARQKNKQNKSSIDVAKTPEIKQLIKSLTPTQDELNMALITAAAEGQVDLVRQLLKKGGKQGATNRNGDTAIFLAVKNGHLDICKVLYENGADLEQRHTNGSLLIHVAALLECQGICQFLIENGADVKGKTSDNFTALHVVASKGNIPFCQFLLDSGAQINSKNSQGLTPLHSAIQTGQIPTAQFLIEKGADIKAKTDGGWTVLHLAAETGNLAACKLLIQLGADPNWRDGKKKTPMDHSKSHPEVFQHLKTLTKKTSLLSILRN